MITNYIVTKTWKRRRIWRYLRWGRNGVNLRCLSRLISPPGHHCRHRPHPRPPRTRTQVSKPLPAATNPTDTLRLCVYRENIGIVWSEYIQGIWQIIEITTTTHTHTHTVYGSCVPRSAVGEESWSTARGDLPHDAGVVVRWGAGSTQHLSSWTW